MVFKFKKAPKHEESGAMPGEGLTDEEFAAFCDTPEAIQRIPNGVLTSPDGLTLYIDGAGLPWTAKQWEKRFGYKPKKVWDRMRKQKIAILGWNSEKIQVVGRLGNFPTQDKY